MAYAAPWNAPKRRLVNTDVVGQTTAPVSHVPMSDATPVAPKKEPKKAAEPKPVEVVVEPAVEAEVEPEVEE